MKIDKKNRNSFFFNIPPNNTEYIKRSIAINSSKNPKDGKKFSNTAYNSANAYIDTINDEFFNDNVLPILSI